jgi:hypothetical protein
MPRPEEYLGTEGFNSTHTFPHHHGSGPQQVKHLKEFTSYYRFDSGDVPVGIVATDIKEAAKLASMPGVVGPDTVFPIDIKDTGKTVGVAMPVSTISFDTVIIPDEAKIAGAWASPAAFEVRNGENVIFEAHEPFGYAFDGWYRTGKDERLSDKTLAEIDVYDMFQTRLRYEARFTANPSLRSGRYLDLTRGNIITLELKAGAAAAPFGKAIWDSGTISSYFAQITDLDLTDPDNKTIVFTKDPTVTQPGDFALSGTFKFSPVGINITVGTVTLDNIYGYVTGSVISLQFLGEI